MATNSCDPQSGKNEGFSCEWQPEKKQSLSEENKSALYKFNGDYTWQGTESEVYKPDGSNFANILRHVLIGNHGESSLFNLRYFEVGKGGYSSLERHRHEHVVVCVRGKGKAVIGDKVHDLGFLDTVYISPNEPHQLLNAGDEPFGFLCIVNSERDRPAALSKEELRRLRGSKEASNIIKV